MAVPVIDRSMRDGHDYEQRLSGGTMNSPQTPVTAPEHAADADRYLDLHMARVEADRDPSYHTELMTAALRSHVPADRSESVV